MDEITPSNIITHTLTSACDTMSNAVEWGRRRGSDSEQGGGLGKGAGKDPGLSATAQDLHVELRG